MTAILFISILILIYITPESPVYFDNDDEYEPGSGFVSSLSGLFRHQFASNDPEIVIHGTEIADASPSVAIFPICMAMTEASPPFCIPTSNEIVLQVASSRRINRPLQ